MPIKSPDGKSEFISACELCTKRYPSYMIDGEVIIIVKMNDTARKETKLSSTCEVETGYPPHICGNTAHFTIERGFPIQD